MARYVLDANVVVAWLLSRPLAEDFVGSLRTDDELIAPLLMLPECTSTLRSEVFAGRLGEGAATEFLSTLLSMPFQLVDSGEQFLGALRLASRFRHRNAYDMQYLAVAELSEAELVTLDRGLRHAADEIGIPVRFLP